jgi:tRNA A37 threonylcarbamoyladenosine dehydratase
MRERIARINPGCIVHAVDEFVDADNWPRLLPSRVNAVIDACDEVKAKVAMAAWALHTKTPFISCGAAGGKRLAHKVDIDDLSKTTHDPLLAQVRYRLRKFHGAPKEGKKIGVDCVFSREAVAPPDASCNIEGADSSLNCHGYGSVVSVTATFGQCAAGWLLDRIASQKRISTKL